MDDLRTTRIEEEVHELRRAVEELSILNDLASRIGALGSSQEIIETIVRKSVRAIGVEQGVIRLLDRLSDSEKMKTLIRTGLSGAGLQKYTFDQSLLGWMELHREPLMINDPERETRFQGVEWDPQVRSLLAVPLMSKSDLIGVLTLYNKKSEEGFTKDDMRLLSIIGGQSAQVIENSRLFEEEKELFAR